MNDGMSTLSAADVAAVTRNNDNGMWGDGGWFWIIILAFLFCGNGWGNNNGAQNAFVSDEFVKRDIFNTNQNVSNTACETQRDVLENRYTTQLGLQNLQAQQAQCCCNTQKEILQSRYDAALQAQNMQAQNVKASTLIAIPSGSSFTVSVGNISATSVLVKDANIIIKKLA